MIGCGFDINGGLIEASDASAGATGCTADCATTEGACKDTSDGTPCATVDASNAVMSHPGCARGLEAALLARRYESPFFAELSAAAAEAESFAEFFAESFAESFESFMMTDTLSAGGNT